MSADKAKCRSEPILDPEREWSKPTKRMWACAIGEGGLAAMAASIRDGADLDAVDRHGLGAIHMVMLHGKELSKIRLLLDSGARGIAMNRSYDSEMALAQATLAGPEAVELMAQWLPRAQKAALSKAVTDPPPTSASEPRRL